MEPKISALAHSRVSCKNGYIQTNISVAQAMWQALSWTLSLQTQGDNVQIIKHDAAGECPTQTHTHSAAHPEVRRTVGQGTPPEWGSRWSLKAGKGISQADKPKNTILVREIRMMHLETMEAHYRYKYMRKGKEKQDRTRTGESPRALCTNEAMRWNHTEHVWGSGLDQTPHLNAGHFCHYC